MQTSWGKVGLKIQVFLHKCVAISGHSSRTSWWRPTQDWILGAAIQMDSLLLHRTMTRVHRWISSTEHCKSDHRKLRMYVAHKREELGWRHVMNEDGNSKNKTTNFRLICCSSDNRRMAVPQKEAPPTRSPQPSETELVCQASGQWMPCLLICYQ